MMKKLMFSMAIVSALSILSGCYNMDTLSVRPSKTTVTYGTSSSTAEKDAKNDVLTDTEKESWTVKQEFLWGKKK
jgi:outer membrane lipoprotein SlyB